MTGTILAGVHSSFRFAGKHGYVTDEDTGMQLLGARFYLPTLGRFLTQDPIGQAGGLNLYAYCDNNPLTHVDPDGLYVKVFNKGNAVRLVLPVVFAGPGATQSVIKQYVQGIEQRWSGQFGRYKVIMDVVVVKPGSGQKANTVTITKQYPFTSRTYTSKAPTTGIWESRPPPGISLGEIGAHESGHLMNLGDTYPTSGPNKGHPVRNGDIMGNLSGLPIESLILKIITKN